MENLLTLICFIYLAYCQDQMCDYKIEKYYCKKNKGNCKNCNCWSCKKHEYEQHNT